MLLSAGTESDRQGKKKKGDPLKGISQSQLGMV
jgi:hypothetical protein